MNFFDIRNKCSITNIAKLAQTSLLYNIIKTNTSFYWPLNYLAQEIHRTNYKNPVQSLKFGL